MGATVQKESLAVRQQRIMSRLLDRPAREFSDGIGTVRMIRDRLPVSILPRLEAAGLGRQASNAIIPKRTLEHRRNKKQKLTVSESEKAWRFAHALGLAIAVFGDERKADEWLNKPLRQFAGQAPLAMLDTEVGSRLVEDSLVRIDEGYFA